MKKQLRACIASALLVCVVACGGGGGGSPPPAGQNEGGTSGGTDGGGPPPPDAPGLSPTQAAFEDAALASNGGLYFPQTNAIPRMGRVTLIELELTSTTLPQSPLGSSQPIQASYSLGTPLLPVIQGQSPFRYESDPTWGFAFLEEGEIQFFANKAAPAYSYQDSNVLVSTRATRGIGSAQMLVIDSVKVPLVGTFADAPEEFRNRFGTDSSRFAGTVTFLPGAAYYRERRVRAGDYVQILDRGNEPWTDPMSATPMSVDATLEIFFTVASLYDTSIPKMSAGTIRTLKGARCWVSTSELDSTVAVPSYRVYCESAGNVYQGIYQPDRAQLVTPTYTVDGPRWTPYQIRLNKAGADSIMNMVAASPASHPITLSAGQSITVSRGQPVLAPLGTNLQPPTGAPYTLPGHEERFWVPLGTVLTVPAGVTEPADTLIEGE